jgi:hypothetical protein
MTALERQLAKTFRAARWVASNGLPVCPDCFDGLDLEKPVPDPLTPGLARYSCGICRTEFSDVKGTVVQTLKPVRLALWAYLVLLGDPGRLDGLTSRQVKRCWDLFAKIKLSPLALDWRERLEAASITAERLRKYLNAARRAA